MTVKKAWALDIGKSAIKAVQIQATKDGAEIVGIDFIPILDDDGTDEGRTAAVDNAVAEFILRNRIIKDPLYFSIPGHAIFMRPVTLPPVGEDKLAELIDYEARQHIPFPLSEVVYGYQLLNEEEFKAGQEPRINLFAVRREMLHPYMVLMGKYNLNLIGLQFNPVATFNYVKYDIAPKQPIVVLDIGAENTSLILIDGNNFWIRNLPLAGNDVTKRLQKRLKISYEDAEKLKRSMPESKQAGKLMEVIEPTLKDLVSEVHRSLGFYKSQAAGVKFTHVLLLGTGSNIYGLQRYLKNQLQLNVSRVTKFQNVKMNAMAERAFQGLEPAGFATTVGLALQAVGLSENKVNLMPTEMLQVRQVAKSRPWFIAAVALLGVAIAVMGLRGQLELNSLRKAAGPLKDTLSTIAGHEGDIQQSQENPHLVNQVDKLFSYNNNRHLVTDVLKNVLNNLGTENWRYSDGAGWLLCDKDGNPLEANFSGSDEFVVADMTNKIYISWVETSYPSISPGGSGRSSGEAVPIPLVAQVRLLAIMKHLGEDTEQKQDNEYISNLAAALQDSLQASYPKTRVVPQVAGGGRTDSQRYNMLPPVYPKRSFSREAPVIANPHGSAEPVDGVAPPFFAFEINVFVPDTTAIANYMVRHLQDAPAEEAQVDPTERWRQTVAYFKKMFQSGKIEYGTKNKFNLSELELDESSLLELAKGRMPESVYQALLEPK